MGVGRVRLDGQAVCAIYSIVRHVAEDVPIRIWNSGLSIECAVPWLAEPKNAVPGVLEVIGEDLECNPMIGELVAS
jgi:hypothetical protein